MVSNDELHAPAVNSAEWAERSSGLRTSRVNSLTEAIKECGRDKAEELQERMHRLIALLWEDEGVCRVEAACALSGLSKDEFYESVMCSIGGGKMVGLVRLIPHEEELDFSVPDFRIFSSTESTDRLVEIYCSLAPGVYIWRSSSLKEDSAGFPRGLYGSYFFIKKTAFDEQEAKRFCATYTDVIESLTGSEARGYWSGELLIDSDLMFAMLQKVPGHTARLKDLWDGREDEFFFPSVSGVTKHHPYRASTVISQINPGLNTRTVRGKYSTYMATDSVGNTRTPDRRFLGFEGERSPGCEALLWSSGRMMEVRVPKGGPLPHPDDALLDAVTRQWSQDMLLEKLQDRVVAVLRRMEAEYGNRELEWTFESEKLYLVQNTLSSTHCRASDFPIELMSVEPEKLLFSSSTVFGHQQTIPMPVVYIELPEGVSPRMLGERTMVDIQDTVPGGRFIVVCDRGHFSLNQDDPDALEGKVFYSTFSGLKGWVDTSGNEVVIGAHYEEALASKNIPVISVKGVDRDRMRKICHRKLRLSPDEKSRYEVRYSTTLFVMAVDAISERGQLYQA